MALQRPLWRRKSNGSPGRSVKSANGRFCPPRLAATGPGRDLYVSSEGGLPVGSLVTDFAGLSVRSPTNDAWRTCPSGVHSANSTSATITGFTLRSPPGLRLEKRPDFFGAPAKGIRVARFSRAVASVPLLPSRSIPCLRFRPG